jgi:hypothetical protein
MGGYYDKFRRYGLGPDINGAGNVDDDTGVSVLLWRPGSQEKRSFYYNAIILCLMPY